MQSNSRSRPKFIETGEQHTIIATFYYASCISLSSKTRTIKAENHTNLCDAMEEHHHLDHTDPPSPSNPTRQNRPYVLKGIISSSFMSIFRFISFSHFHKRRRSFGIKHPQVELGLMYCKIYSSTTLSKMPLWWEESSSLPREDWPSPLREKPEFVMGIRGCLPATPLRRSPWLALMLR